MFKISFLNPKSYTLKSRSGGPAPLEISRSKGLPPSRRRRESGSLTGQVMIISVVTLGGILLTSAGIAGLIMLYQIRSANETVGSAKALFAADAGIEAASFCYFRGGCDPELTASSPALRFNDSQVSASTTSSLTPEFLTITTRGYAAGGRIIRILEVTFATSSP